MIWVWCKLLTRCNLIVLSSSSHLDIWDPFGSVPKIWYLYTPMYGHFDRTYKEFMVILIEHIKWDSQNMSKLYNIIYINHDFCIFSRIFPTSSAIWPHKLSPFSAFVAPPRKAVDYRSPWALPSAASKRAARGAAWRALFRAWLVDGFRLLIPMGYRLPSGPLVMFI